MSNTFLDLSKLNEEEIDFYNFSLKNIGIYINQNIQEIAKIYGCGISFIYSFFSKIGVTGLKDFLYKVGFFDGLRANLTDDNIKMNEKYSVENIEKYLLLNYTLNIKQNLDMLKDQIYLIKDLCKQIKLYNNVFGFGIGHAEICIHELFSSFLKFNINCTQFFKKNKSNELTIEIEKKLKSVKGAVFIIYSFRGCHEFTSDIIKKIKNINSKIVLWLITANVKTSFNKYVDKIIFINNNVKEINYIDNPILISLANSFIFFNDFLKNLYVHGEYKKISRSKEFLEEIETLRTGKN